MESINLNGLDNITKIDISNNQIEEVSNLVMNENIGMYDLVMLQNNNLDCSDWDDVELLLNRLGEEERFYTVDTEEHFGLVYSPQKGIDPYICTPITNWGLH